VAATAVAAAFEMTKRRKNKKKINKKKGRKVVSWSGDLFDSFKSHTRGGNS
jgi:hypothetical protein